MTWYEWVVGVGQFVAMWWITDRVIRHRPKRPQGVTLNASAVAGTILANLQRQPHLQVNLYDTCHNCHQHAPIGVQMGEQWWCGPCANLKRYMDYNLSLSAERRATPPK